MQILQPRQTPPLQPRTALQPRLSTLLSPSPPIPPLRARKAPAPGSRSHLRLPPLPSELRPPNQLQPPGPRHHRRRGSSTSTPTPTSTTSPARRSHDPTLATASVPTDATARATGGSSTTVAHRPGSTSSTSLESLSPSTATIWSGSPTTVTSTTAHRCLRERLPRSGVGSTSAPVVPPRADGGR